MRGGIDSIEHGIFLTEECVEEMTGRGTFLVPTLAAVKNIIAHKEQGVPAYAVEKCERVVVDHIRSVRMFYQAGGRIAMGTDAGTPYNRHGVNALELLYMVEDAGVSPTDSLIFSTRNGAELMGLADRGTVAEGKAADLLIVDGNPVEDIAMAAMVENHRLVVKNGVVARAR